MDIQALAKEVIISKGGVAKSADFVAAGIPAAEVVHLHNIGYLERVCHGYYLLAEQRTLSNEQLLATLLPQGIICVETALFRYGYSGDFYPRRWSVAVPRTMSKVRLDLWAIPLQPYYIQPELHELGKTTVSFRGVRLPTYDRERTICDCFKYRSRLDRTLIRSALDAYAMDPWKDLYNLEWYARELRVSQKVSKLLEVLGR